MLSALGYAVLIPQKNEEEQSDDPKLYLKTTHAEATGRYSDNEFVVYNGSKVRLDLTPSCPSDIKAARETHASKIDDKGITKENIYFSSPSAAAGFVAGASINGRTNWKTEDGTTLKQLEEAKAK